ncbi:MmgE/PrpD family protein [Paracoccus sp. pheM1]|uniref:MmgE/PrpD family protein n=1 Tax=Paracoccus sp. pheM1 TaxID=2831675 RepID=UPI001BDB92F1|nr:MmgE/PrpD family protein [Paracoccus sp. pheM1]MBT0781866.1 MmgE/PrpD family protein [Paracoccus sp. pheM1]
MKQDAPNTAGLTLRLATHVAALANAMPSAEDTEAMRRLFLDGFIVSLWGITRPAVRQISEWSRRFAGTGPSMVLGADWTADPSVAALVHGTAGHAYELDDTHDVTTSHPGCVIIPAALAVGAQTGASQADLFRAAIAGYEAMALIGGCAGGLETVHRGFHPTSVFGSFGAATAAVALRAYARGQEVTPDMLLQAWGHALSQACGSMQFSAEPTGGEVKRVHAGLGARNGVLAADFAELSAVTAPLQAAEGAYGVAGLFGGPLQAVEPGEKQIHVISLKPYSCCRLFHSTIDALREVTDDFTVPTDSIAEILIQGPRLVAEQHMTRAESTMTAQYSCPYIVAATLAYGPTRYDAYGEEFLDDPRILSLVAKVRFQVDAEIEREYYPRQFASRVTMRLADGGTRSALVVDSVGTARKPLSVEQIIAKGEGLAHLGRFPSGGALAAALWDDASDARRLAEVLNGTPAA